MTLQSHKEEGGQCGRQNVGLEHVKLLVWSRFPLTVDDLSMTTVIPYP